ncbi:MAG TPA: hypothetical protein VGE39_17365 [Prosthecobacter sp.]
MNDAAPALSFFSAGAEAADLPTVSPQELAELEQKLVDDGLAKLRAGESPTTAERRAIERAGERFHERETEARERRVVTELGLEVLVSDRLDKRGIHDASRLLERKPEVFHIIARLLAQNVPVRDICDICHVGEHTVQSVQDHPAGQLAAATQKEHFVAKLRLAASLGIEGIIAQFRTGDVSPIAWGIVMDKLALAEGGVTARTEVVHTSSGEDDYLRMVREAREAALALRPPGMVIEVENLGQRAAESVPLALPGHPQSGAGNSPTSDDVG